MPERIRFNRFDGDKLPEGAVLCTRPGRWGNPWRVVDLPKHHGSATVYTVLGPGLGEPVRGDLVFASKAEAIECAVRIFRRALSGRSTLYRLPYTAEDVARELVGKDLACTCALDSLCHASVLLATANVGG